MTGIGGGDEITKKLYHFCVMHPTGHYFDGTCSIDANLATGDGYDALKASIGKSMSPQREGKDIILLSLTVIG